MRMTVPRTGSRDPAKPSGFRRVGQCSELKPTRELGQDSCRSRTAPRRAPSALRRRSVECSTIRALRLAHECGGPVAEDAGFEARAEAGRLIGPFNAALLTPAISSAFIELAVAEQKNTSLGKRSREVIILMSGRSLRTLRRCPASRPIRRRGPNTGRQRAAEGSHGGGGSSPPCRPRTVARTSSRRGALSRGGSATPS
jgi:hypothetical protein